MKKISVIVLFYCLIPPLAFAFQWPSSPESLTHSFCVELEYGISKGLCFKEPESVRPFDSGKVVYRYCPDPFSALPGDQPSLLVLEHENGFQSVYEGLDSADVGNVPPFVGNGQLISEHPSAGSYGFYIRDARLKRLVNPLLLLPGLNDVQAPDLLTLRLYSSDGGIYDIKQNASIPAGIYGVYVQVQDRINRKNPLVLMPYNISLYNLGSLEAERKLDTLVQADGVLSLQDGVSAEDLYNDESFLYLGEMLLNSGAASFELTVEDFFGNELSVDYGFKVLR